MDADLGVMTVQRRDCRKASPVTRWSRSPARTSDPTMNRRPAGALSSDGSAILSCLAFASATD